MEIGDKVLITDNLKELREKFNQDITFEMLEYADKKAKITEVLSDSWYELNIDDGVYWWSEKWLKPVKNNITDEFITFNEVIGNIQMLWSNMSEDDKTECIQLFFGLKNKYEMINFIDKYTPVKH